MEFDQRAREQVLGDVEYAVIHLADALERVQAASGLIYAVGEYDLSHRLDVLATDVRVSRDEARACKDAVASLVESRGGF